MDFQLVTFCNRLRFLNYHLFLMTSSFTLVGPGFESLRDHKFVNLCNSYFRHKEHLAKFCASYSSPVLNLLQHFPFKKIMYLKSENPERH